MTRPLDDAIRSLARGILAGLVAMRKDGSARHVKPRRPSARPLSP
jgi:hypothetical protein